MFKPITIDETSETILPAWRIYLKTPSMSRAMALGRGGPVGNLIYALLYPSEEAAKSDAESLIKLNPGVSFEVRKVPGGM